MEVILKRTKITKSIVDQSLFGNNKLYLGHPNYEVLGWCSILKGKFRYNYILLYCKVTNVTVKLEKRTGVEVTEGTMQTAREGTRDDWYFPMFYTLLLGGQGITRTQDREECYRDEEKLKKFLREVEQKGQIFI